MIPTPEALDALAGAIEDTLKELYGANMGFALFMFPYKQMSGDYVSNCKREDMIKFIREVADRIEKGEAISRPIGTA
jgi:hypothetical protein